MNILFDTNLLLDVYIRREPFFEHSSLLMANAEQGIITGWVSSTSITTLHYLVGKWRDKNTANKIIESTLKIFNVSTVNRAVLEGALTLGFSDYEDAVLHQSAIFNNLDGILTRNKKDFSKASLAIFTPEELLAVL